MHKATFGKLFLFSLLALCQHIILLGPIATTDSPQPLCPRHPPLSSASLSESNLILEPFFASIVKQIICP